MTDARSDVMIRLENISKKFPGMDGPAVTDLSIEVGKGEILTLVGPSGCGKTTTLKMINRIIEPGGGKIWVDGVDTSSVEPYQLRLGIGYVIQQIGLFPHRTIYQNIATVPQLYQWDRDRIRARVEELIQLVGLEEGMLDRYPAELSGGQQQRVGVARALAADPPVLLMDEPFGAVDPIVRGRLQDELLNLQAQLSKTIVFVTHDIDEAIHLGDKIAILNVGGVLEQLGPPEEILRQPASPFVKDFLGGERGLKRLGLIRVDQTEMLPGPMVPAEATAGDARRAMKEARTDWFGVVSDGVLDGWIASSRLEGRGDEASLDGLEREEFLVVLPCDASLREALDAVVTSRARVAMVVDGGRYVGMLDVDTIAEEITE